MKRRPMLAGIGASREQNKTDTDILLSRTRAEQHKRICALSWSPELRAEIRLQQALLRLQAARMRRAGSEA